MKNTWKQKFLEFEILKFEIPKLTSNADTKIYRIYCSTFCLQSQLSIDQRSNTLHFIHEVLITYMQMNQLKIKSIFLF